MTVAIFHNNKLYIETLEILKPVVDELMKVCDILGMAKVVEIVSINTIKVGDSVHVRCERCLGRDVLVCDKCNGYCDFYDDKAGESRDCDVCEEGAEGMVDCPDCIEGCETQEIGYMHGTVTVKVGNTVKSLGPLTELDLGDGVKHYIEVKV